MKILIAVDCSACSTRAVRYVTKHLRFFGKRPSITLLHLDPPILERVTNHVSPVDIARFHERNGKVAVRAAKAILTKARIPHREKLLVGDPDGTIARTAKEDRCNMIVMGSHGHGALKGLFLGSVVTKVLAQTSIPVLVVR